MSSLRACAWLSGALVLCSVTAPAAAAVTRTPYLQSLTATSVVIMWQTDSGSGADSQVHYGTALAARSQTATATASDSVAAPGLRNHAVLLSGLSAGTRYYYDIGSASGGVEAGGTSEHYFDTAPTPGAATPFSFWVVGDSGTNGSEQHMVRDSMLGATAADRPDLFLQVGDMAYNIGSDDNFTLELFGVYADILRHTPFWPALGNHEGSDGSSDSPTQSGPYYEAFTLPAGGQAGGVASGTEAYYAFDYANAHFIALDSDDSSLLPGSPQLVWLAADLAGVAASTSRQWVIAWFHHPPYSKGSHDSNVAADSAGRMLRVRENVLPILEAGGVDLVLSGHSHGYERSYLIRGAYGLGESPDFATPSFAQLSAGGYIVNAGDGAPSGDGAYRKPSGVSASQGTLYVVAGHGGNELGGSFGHPVMHGAERRFGSCIVNVDATRLRLRNLRSDGVVTDDVAIAKLPLTCAGAAACDDDDLCTIDGCSNGHCVNTAVECDDANACTNESCAPALGCEYAPVACADGDVCTIDACFAASGCAHAALTCDDGDVCTDDHCQALVGCVAVPNASCEPPPDAGTTSEPDTDAGGGAPSMDAGGMHGGGKHGGGKHDGAAMDAAISNDDAAMHSSRMDAAVSGRDDGGTSGPGADAAAPDASRPRDSGAGQGDASDAGDSTRSAGCGCRLVPSDQDHSRAWLGWVAGLAICRRWRRQMSRRTSRPRRDSAA